MIGFGTRISGFLGGTTFSTPPPTKTYGSFYDTITRTISLNSPTPIRLNSTDSSATYGVAVQNDLSGNPTKIVVTQTGVYNLQFSAQVQKTSGGGSETLTIWINVNGTQVPNTSTQVTLANNSVLLTPAWNFYVYMTSGQYVQLMASATSSTINFQAIAESLSVPYPAVPSTILTIVQL